MFLSKKENKSGSVSVQVIDKNAGCRVVETTGSARDEEEIVRLYQEGIRKIHSDRPGRPWVFPCRSPEGVIIERFVKKTARC